MNIVIDILDILLVPALYLFFTFRMIDAKMTRESDARSRDYNELVNEHRNLTIRLDIMEKHCLKLSEEWTRAGITSSRTCPSCDTKKLDKDFEAMDYICIECRVRESF